MSDSPSEHLPPSPSPGISTGFAVVFYGGLLGLGWLLGSWWLDLDLLEWHNRWETQLWLDALLGVALGAATVVASRILENTTEWARVLTREFRKYLGDLNSAQVLVFAVTSGIAEEIFFRGFLQQALSDLVFSNEWIGLIVASVVFGLVHIGPDQKKFLPWTMMAVVLGFLFGLLYMYTGNVLGPIVAHFTINFFNLSHIAEQPPPEDDDGAVSEDDSDGTDPWTP